ncbi:glucoamylase family protein [Terrimonas pollutisoli]|uniref:glucoamylase family protein n=1 Tax=Terrimonas pollutisoli TaxID=3034147 RepID=UPI0023ECE1C2|nr:glucoamylase family protein [Terrimonas sp. H1YJ31]
MRQWLFFITVVLAYGSCSKKKDETASNPKNPIVFYAAINSGSFNSTVYNVNLLPTISFKFTQPLLQASLASAISFKNANNNDVPFSATLQNADSLLVIRPSSPLVNLTKYNISISTFLKSASNGSLPAKVDRSFITTIDSTRKFPVIAESALLDSIQKRTFNYFWELAHPVSGMIRERNTDANTYTSGGTGFGIMAIVTAIHRNFITRAEGLTRLKTMVSFLKNTAETFHGAYPHWLNGETGKVIPFSANDNGADLVETSYLVQGLLTARQFFDGVAADEATLRDDINTIVNKVEWDWFRKNNENTLYWHWTPSNANGWIMNMPIKGWNECLITYVLAASSTTHSVPKIVYDNGWASNGSMKNGNTYYGYNLPLGPDIGGPLFFSHYSFLGIDPNGLSDAYGNYATQTKNHTLINYSYCKANPKNFYGYSDSVWGLTASDIPNSYTASSPTNDVGVIAPTAAISSIPYTPQESMKALKFFYYVLGDKIWTQYGFRDAFSLNDLWYANSFLAIDQGPIIVMIENYRSGLLWDLFTSCPEVKTGMKALGFTAPYL